MNRYNPNIHHRRSIRLKGYDYAQAGLYFITICCQDRACLFGEIKNGEMIWNDAGKIAHECWLAIPQHFPDVVLHNHIIMPNHVHGILELVGAKNFSPENNEMVSPINNEMVSPENHEMVSPENHENISSENNENISPINNENELTGNGAKNFSPLRRSPSKTIGSVVRGFKIGVTKWMRQNTNVYDVWQRNYYEHIIRDEKSYQTISQYIINNPAKWWDDKFYKK